MAQVLSLLSSHHTHGPSVSSTTDCTTDCNRREGPQEPPDLCGLKFTANPIRDKEKSKQTAWQSIGKEWICISLQTVYNWGSWFIVFSTPMKLRGSIQGAYSRPRTTGSLEFFPGGQESEALSGSVLQWINLAQYIYTPSFQAYVDCINNQFLTFNTSFSLFVNQMMRKLQLSGKRLHHFFDVQEPQEIAQRSWEH